jgi:hypothetical protein
VSTVHAEVCEVGAGWVVVDDGLSRNSTRLNGERIGGRRRLRDGDQIEVGETVLVFRDPQGRKTRSISVTLLQAAPPDLSPAQLRALVALCRPFHDGTKFARPPTNQQIAEELSLTVAAVKTHLRALFQRFGIADVPQNEKRARLVQLAFDRRVVFPSDLESSPSLNRGGLPYGARAR